MPSTTTLPLVAAPVCCGIGVDGGLSREAAQTSAALLKAVADPVRLQLLSAIRATEQGEACVCDLTALVGLSQPTVSHHLKVLVGAGLLEREKRGTWAWFRLVPSRLDDVAAIFR
jgi:ArsR family transcriptional regulator